jgi:hypothetical protein
MGRHTVPTRQTRQFAMRDPITALLQLRGSYKEPEHESIFQGSIEELPL